MAGRGGSESLLYLLDEAFRGRGIEESDESQALLTNLATVPDDAWRALPDGAVRGEDRETRLLIGAMITHDAHHAGEINHIRSLLVGDDRWRYVEQGFG